MSKRDFNVAMSTNIHVQRMRNYLSINVLSSLNGIFNVKKGNKAFRKCGETQT